MILVYIYLPNESLLEWCTFIGIILFRALPKATTKLKMVNKSIEILKYFRMFVT